MKACCWLFACVVCTMVSCTKTYTRFYGDEQDSGLSIFSNTGNEVMSCYVNGVAWRTQDRETFTGITTNEQSEVYVEILRTSSTYDTLAISWQSEGSAIGLVLPIDKDLVKGFNYLRQKRLLIDTTNGFFTSDINGFNVRGLRGTGSIYFLEADLNQTSSDRYTGKFSGIFEANFDTDKITRGRFDHTLNPGNVIILR